MRAERLHGQPNKSMRRTDGTRTIYPFPNKTRWNLQPAVANEAIHYIKHLKEIASARPTSGT